MSQTTPDQEAHIRARAAEGATLSDIQNELRDKFDLHLTYMDARLLLIDLNVRLAEDEEVEEEKVEDEEESLPEDFAPEQDGASRVKLETDAITTPGSVASGSVTFSDGKTAKWMIDSAGRLGFVPPEPGYKPPTEDTPEFQHQLQLAMRRLGYY